MKAAKFEDLSEAFWYIADNPEEYLSEKSVLLFPTFWGEYARRYEIERKPKKSFGIPRAFYDYVDKKYDNMSSHGPYHMINFYSRNEAEAFDKFFETLREFLSVNNLDYSTFYEPSTGRYDQVDFYTLVKAVIARPPMYLGTISFRLLVQFINGYLRAIKDFNLEETEQEKTFLEFAHYIETKYVNLSGPSWDKIIWYKTMNDFGAFQLFHECLNEFAFQGKKTVDNVEYHWKRKQARK